ncbi:MAG: DNA mismatch repair protein MutL [Bacillariaceae sp.]|jgi:DNA mismatch repair protein MutL
MMSPTTTNDDDDDDDGGANKVNNNNNADGRQGQKKEQKRRQKIAILPSDVVDQIAAGEVVQRPVSVVKELIENSLDAKATHIVVQFDGLKKMCITDNGCGVKKIDLPLLCTRHATSKLNSVDDFSDLSTFGFRGEALASTSMVSRLLTVVSRARVDDDDDNDDDDDDNINNANKNNGAAATATVAAYSQSYQNGKPTQPKAKPCASKVGTKITIEDLFYNVPHRQQAYSKRESEEYGKIHRIVQDYAVHYPTVGFVCQRTSTSKSKHKTLIVDCNTGQIPAVKILLQSRDSAAAAAAAAKSSSLTKEPQNNNNNNDDNSHDQQQQRHKEKVMEATKQVLSHVLESNLADYLLYMECNQDADETISSSSSSPSSSTSTSTSSKYKFKYAAQIYFTSPAYNSTTRKSGTRGGNKNTNTKQSQGKFIIFLNHRLVDLPPLKRALEDVYSDFGNPNRNKNNGSRNNNNNIGKPVLVVNLKIPGSQVDVNVHPSKRQVALMFQEDLVTALAQKLRQRLEEHGQQFLEQSVVIRNPYADDKKNQNKKRKKSSVSDLDKDDDDEKSDGDDDDEAHSSKINDCSDGIDVKITKKNDQNNKKLKINSNNNNNDKKKVAPSKLIRTNNAVRAGAIEPFLVSTQQSMSSTQDDATRDEASQPLSRSVLHVSTCPLSKPCANIDLSQPGAFANALKQERCTCPTDESRRTVLVKQAVVRPKRVVPTQAKYASIASLRKRVGKQQCPETTQQIRTAFFMGALSNQRSLIQCGEDLVMINHLELAKELFYQLALARFGGGAKLAHLGSVGSNNGGIHIQAAIAQALQCEDDLLQYEERGELSTDMSSVDGDSSCGNVDTSDVSRSGMLQVSDTNDNLAHQATARLVESSGMLEEYFSIRIEIRKSSEDNANRSKDNNDDVTGDAILTCLPVLLDGHQPQSRKLLLFRNIAYIVIYNRPNM